jgi:hypothetical protein
MTFGHGPVAVRREEDVADSFRGDLGHNASTVVPGQRAWA